MPQLLVPGTGTTGAAFQTIQLPNVDERNVGLLRRSFAKSRLVGVQPDQAAYAADINSENKRRSAVNAMPFVTMPLPRGGLDDFGREQATYLYMGNPPPFSSGSAVAQALTGYLAPWGIIW